MKEVGLSSSALRDAEDARSWYDRQDPGVGDEFIHDLDYAIARIRERPGAFRRIGADCHKYVMHPFPYFIVYEERPEIIWIIAVYHTSRNPDDLTKRLGESDE